MNKITIGLAILLILGAMGISGCTDSENSTSNATDTNMAQYEQNLINLQENPKAYVGKNVTVVGPRGISMKYEANPTIGQDEGTEIWLGDSKKVGSSQIAVWYTGPPVELELFGKIKVTGEFVRNSEYRYGTADYVIITDKIEGIK